MIVDAPRLPVNRRYRHFRRFTYGNHTDTLLAVRTVSVMTAAVPHTVQIIATF